jgi:hypothetical protein
LSNSNWVEQAVDAMEAVAPRVPALVVLGEPVDEEDGPVDHVDPSRLVSRHT